MTHPCPLTQSLFTDLLPQVWEEMERDAERAVNEGLEDSVHVDEVKARAEAWRRANVLANPITDEPFLSSSAWGVE